MDRFNPLKCKKLHEDAVLPTRANKTDAGVDFYSINCYRKEDIITHRTGIAVEIPRGYVGLLFPRSSIYKKDLKLANSVGVIDEGYRGEVRFKFRVTGNTLNFYSKGDRIGQLVIFSNPKFSPEWVEKLSESERGTGGFGSSGK